ncbi:KdsC family phosphatase [Clostridium sp. M62/1]|uniref:KdsC family phosphatase n=1 Tax=Clostridium sp. M62/1 TaxID=411486 RepID=UPI003564CEDE
MCKGRIKYLVMDVDGTLTDGKIYMGNDGEVMKAFSIKDGYGIHDILIPKGIIPIILTGRKSNIVYNRCLEMGIKDIYQGINNKLETLLNIVNDLSLVAYIGDDLNDLSCMIEIKKAGGIIACPKDATRKVREMAEYIASHDGGNGAVRDFIEWLLGCECKLYCNR